MGGIKRGEIMKVNELKRLSTERLVLRPVALRDAPAMFEYLSDIAVAKWVVNGVPQTNVSEAVASINNYFLKDPVGKWAITRPKEDILMGTIDLRVDAHNRTAEVGYVLNPKYQHQGYVTEAVYELVRLSFEELQLGRVWIGHAVGNDASAGVPRRLGFKQEGVLANDHYLNNTWHDTVIWGMTPAMFNTLKSKHS